MMPLLPLLLPPPLLLLLLRLLFAVLCWWCPSCRWVHPALLGLQLPASQPVWLGP